MHVKIEKGSFPSKAKEAYQQFKNERIDPEAPIIVIGYAGKADDDLFVELCTLKNPIFWLLYEKERKKEDEKARLRKALINSCCLTILETQGIEFELSAFEDELSFTPDKTEPINISPEAAVTKAFYYALSTIRLLETVKNPNDFTSLIKNEEKRLKEILYEDAP